MLSSLSPGQWISQLALGGFLLLSSLAATDGDRVDAPVAERALLFSVRANRSGVGNAKRTGRPAEPSLGQGESLSEDRHHHRTRSTDAQRIHIQEIVRAFRVWIHEVEVVSLVPLEAGQHNAERDAGEALWKKLARRIPYAYEAAQLGYNAVGIPMLFGRTLRTKVDFLYERYSLFNFAGVITAKLLGIPLVLEVNSPFALEQARDKEIRACGLRAGPSR